MLIRGATLIHGPCRALCGIPLYPRQLTYAHTLQNTRQYAFDCTLRGPFDNLFLTQLSASWALCAVMAAVTSASTVCLLNLD